MSGDGGGGDAVSGGGGAKKKRRRTRSVAQRRDADMRRLLGLLGSEGDVVSVEGVASRFGIGIDELIRWAAGERAAEAAEKLDRFHDTLARLYVTTACLRAAARLAHRHESERESDGFDGETVRVIEADKLDLDIVKGLLGRAEARGVAAAAGSGSAGVGVSGPTRKDGDGAGGYVPSKADIDAVRAALETLGREGVEDLDDDASGDGGGGS